LVDLIGDDGAGDEARQQAGRVSKETNGVAGVDFERGGVSRSGADDGQRGFVDLNTIPLDAVDHVEVLKDGASSLYGTDAIAGVVNIILKSDYQGESGEAEFGTSQHGGGTMERAAATFGTGDLATDHYNAYINFEYERDDAISVGQRGFPFNTNDLTSIGGAILEPTCYRYSIRGG